ncbi:MAG TPA: hypothetical protein VGE04_19375 [Chloroflexia bacterium]
MQAHKAALLLTTLLLIAALPLLPQTPTRAQETSHTFPETSKTASGIFLQYWTSHGGLAQQGYPISDEMMLASTDGKEYRTQFFQRAVFEHHPEFAGTPNEVLLKLVGQTFYERHFQTTPPPNQTTNPTNTLTFKETGHSIGGKFRDYWEKHGGLAQQGYPMTGEFKMASTDGKEYTTQVFQRAVFELHPEFAGTENEVLLRLLGVEEFEALNKLPTTSTPNVPGATTTPLGANPTATPTAGVREDGPVQTDGIDYRHTVKRETQEITVILDNSDVKSGNVSPGIIKFNLDLLNDFDIIITRVTPSGVTKPSLISEGISPEGPNANLEGYNTIDVGDQTIFYRWEGNDMYFKWAKGWETKKNDNYAKLNAAGQLTRNFILTVASRDGKRWGPKDLLDFMGDNDETKRLLHQMGYGVPGDPSFDEQPWPTLLQVEFP